MGSPHGPEQDMRCIVRKPMQCMHLAMLCAHTAVELSFNIIMLANGCELAPTTASATLPIIAPLQHTTCRTTPMSYTHYEYALSPVGKVAQVSSTP